MNGNTQLQFRNGLDHAEQRRVSALGALTLLNTAAEMEEAIAVHENEIKSVIASETDENGKAIFSNEDKRKAELAVRSANSKLLCDLKTQLSDYRLRAENARISAQYHADCIRVITAFASLMEVE